MFQYVALTDGTTTVELTDGISYALLSYAPVVAPLRDSAFGDGQYSDVSEQITVHAIGTTAALAYAAAAALNSLLDQARRWWLGQAVSPVTLVVQAQDSVLAPISAILKGRAPGGPSNIALPALWHEHYGKYVIENLTLQFVRRAMWLGVSESASVAAANNPSVRTVTMPSAPTVPGPLQLDITGFATSAAGNIDIPNGFVMLATNMDLQEAESPFSSTLAAGATYVSTADATARASAGNVGRLNHAAAAIGVESVLTFVMPGALIPSTQIAVFCTYRNNTASAWSIRASGAAGQIALAPLTQLFTPLTLISGAGNPTALYLGTIVSRFGTDFINLNVALTALSGAGTLDFDTVVFVDLSTGNAAVMSVNGARMAATPNISQNATVTIENSPLTLYAPDVRIRLAGGSRIAQTYAGDAQIVGKGATLKTLWYATHLFGGTTPYWTTQNIAGAAILQVGATISRRAAYVVPS